VSELILYVDRLWISPYAFSSFVALEEKRLDYEVKPIALERGEQRAPEFREPSLTGKVPALRHGDYWLTESLAISEYLAETFPFPKHPRLFPENLQERGRARQLMMWLRTDLLPVREERSSHTLFYERATQPLSEKGRAAAAELVRIADRVIPEGRTTLFNAWCIADAELGFMLQRLNLNGDPLPPKLKAYAEAQWLRPSVRKFAEHPRPPFVPYY
jgi:glutathione S-transferase